MQHKVGRGWSRQIRFAVIEKKDDVGTLTYEVFFDLSCRGIACVARIQDGDRSMTRYVPVDPPMHGHESNIHLLLGARCKKRVDDSVRRHFAGSDEQESRRPLLEEQFFKRGKLPE